MHALKNILNLFYRYVMLNVKLAYDPELSNINLSVNVFWILSAIVNVFKHVHL
jgi:hypothetical protein